MLIPVKMYIDVCPRVQDSRLDREAMWNSHFPKHKGVKRRRNGFLQ